MKCICSDYRILGLSVHGKAQKCIRHSTWTYFQPTGADYLPRTKALSNHYHPNDAGRTKWSFTSPLLLSLSQLLLRYPFSYLLRNWRMCPATTHVEKVVAVIITTLTQNIVQLGLEQPLVVLATNNFLWVELHRLHTPWIWEATKVIYMPLSQFSIHRVCS